ncbi:MAG: type III pantothenate kinase [Pseudomonadota bacterium]
MRLLVDAGNTRLKWVLDSVAGTCVRGVVTHRGHAPGEVLDSLWQELPKPSSVYVACVAGDALRQAIVQRVRSLWPEATLVFLISHSICCGVRVAYTEPARFGVDRLAALVAAFAGARGRAVIVIDAGTAVTVDALDAEGLHLGGVIMPGKVLLGAVLRQGTADLDVACREDGARGVAERVLQVTTQAALRAGVHVMWLGGIERALREVRANMLRDARIVLTGGDSGEVATALGGGVEVRPDLVLEGMALMASEVTG